MRDSTYEIPNENSSDTGCQNENMNQGHGGFKTFELWYTYINNHGFVKCEIFHYQDGDQKQNYKLMINNMQQRYSSFDDKIRNETRKERYHRKNMHNDSQKSSRT